MLGHTSKEVTEYYKKLPNGELNDLYYHRILFGLSMKETRWLGHMVHMGQKRNAYSV
jgi:hypothetical protein